MHLIRPSGHTVYECHTRKGCILHKDCTVPLIYVEQCRIQVKLYTCAWPHIRHLFQEGDEIHDPTFENSIFKGVYSHSKIGGLLIPCNHPMKQISHSKHWGNYFCWHSKEESVALQFCQVIHNLLKAIFSKVGQVFYPLNASYEQHVHNKTSYTIKKMLTLVSTRRGLRDTSFLAAASMELAAPISSFSAITVGSSGSSQSSPGVGWYLLLIKE